MKLIACAATAALLLFSTACSPKLHPDAINTFDSTTYDTFTAAHSALVTLRAQIQTSYPKYETDFNLAAQSYNTALTAYATFRSAPVADTTALAAEIGSVTVSVVSLENAIQADLHVPPAKVSAIRAKAGTIRARTSNPNAITLTDILTELELAATIAEAVPATQPWSTLAAVVIQATDSALTAINAQSGQPINMSTIGPISVIA